VERDTRGTAAGRGQFRAESERQQLGEDEKSAIRSLLLALEPFRRLRHDMPLQYVYMYLLVALREGKGVQGVRS
jgi:hypothetical protein